MKVPNDILFTQVGYEQLQEEQRKLQEQRKDAVEHLKKAREMGDLSENGYYKAAKAKLSSIDHELRRLQYLLRYAKVTNPQTSDTIQVGNSVIVLHEGKEKNFILVGEHEANPSEGKISSRSPLGKAMLGKKQHDEIAFQTPKGLQTYKVVSIQ